MLNWLGVAVACALVLMLLMVLARRSRKEDLAATDAADDPDAAERAVAQHPAAASQTEATAAADGEDAEDEASDEASTGEDEEASASEDAGQKKRSFLHSRHWAILAGEPEPDVLGDRERVEEREVLEHHRDAERARLVRALDLDRPALPAELPGVGVDRAVDDLHQRRLARPVLAEQRMERAGLDLDRHIVERDQRPEDLGHVMGFERRRDLGHHSTSIN